MSRSSGSRPEPTPIGGSGHEPRRRILVFAVVTLLCLAATATYLVVQRNRDVSAAAEAVQEEAGRTRLAVDDVLPVAHLVVRNTEAGPSFGKIALVPLDDPDGPRAIVDVSCERVFSTRAATICLQAVPGVVTAYRAVFLDDRMRQTGTQPLGGVPSRARMSADGSWAASTVFVAGHSYADAQFLTETVVTDMSTQRSLGDLETWTTLRDGVALTAQDRNFWGVTFVGDGPAFYATLATGGTRNLVLGNASTRTMVVLDVEGTCPSASPDGTHLVWKQQDPESGNAHFVAGSAPVAGRAAEPPAPLQEGRLVDDQAAWRDEGTVLYAVGKGVNATVDFDVWTAPVDGGAATRFVADAASPSVVGPATR
jgi:hypothetical protein